MYCFKNCFRKIGGDNIPPSKKPKKPVNTMYSEKLSINSNKSSFAAVIPTIDSKLTIPEKYIDRHLNLCDLPFSQGI
jgi:hypothetical protein